MAGIELVADRLLTAGLGSKGLVGAERWVAARGRLAAPVVMAGG